MNRMSSINTCSPSNIQNLKRLIMGLFWKLSHLKALENRDVTWCTSQIENSFLGNLFNQLLFIHWINWIWTANYLNNISAWCFFLFLRKPHKRNKMITMTSFALTWSNEHDTSDSAYCLWSSLYLLNFHNSMITSPAVHFAEIIFR